MNESATEFKLKGFERIKDVHLEQQTFMEKDLVTTTFKVKRNNAKIFYKPICDKMYEKLA